MTIPTLQTDLPKEQERYHRQLIATMVNELIKVRPPHDKTAAEIAAGVTPVNYGYAPGEDRRYPPGQTDAQLASMAVDGVYRSAEGTMSVATDGLLRAKFTGSSTITELELRSADTVGDVFIRFRDSAGSTKGFIGFTAIGDETMSMTSTEDFRLKFRTGAGDGSTFYNRCHMYGATDQSSWLAVESPRSDNIGGCYITFVQADQTQKGFIGFASTTDNDIDILNLVNAANIDFTTTGTGAVRSNAPFQAATGSVTIPSISFQGDTDMGFYLESANTMRLTVAGTYRAEWTNAAHTLRLQLLGQDGSVGTPALSFENDPDTGIFRVDSNTFGMAAAGGEVARFDASAVAGNTRFMVYDVDNATMERVTVGAADSGGTGFKVLRIPN